MNWLTISERTAEQMQPIVDGSAQAFQYCSDGASVYEALNYHRGYHLVHPSQVKKKKRLSRVKA